MIEVVKGSIGAHPLRRYTEPWVAKEDMYVVKEDELMGEFAPKPTLPQVLDALAGVVDYNRDGTFLQSVRDDSSVQDSSFAEPLGASEESSGESEPEDGISLGSTSAIDYSSDSSSEDDVHEAKKLKK